MAIYGWDASHYDGTLDTATMVKAKAEGIEFFSHKLGEGTGNVDTTAKTALAAARAAGIPVIGAYWFCHNGDDPVAEADRMVARADADEHWWRDFPGWFWQADCETESGQGKPSAAWIKKFADRLVAKTGKVCIVYASHGEYGNSLTGIGHPLWNANYPSSRKAGFKDLYPGDSYAGWVKYSGQVPVISQFSSSATIAGRSTCDANAFRGTVDDLLALIGASAPTPSVPVQPPEVDMQLSDMMANFVWASNAKTSPRQTVETALLVIGNQAHAAYAASLAGRDPAALAKEIAPLLAPLLPVGSPATPVQLEAAIASAFSLLGGEVTPTP